MRTPLIYLAVQGAAYGIDLASFLVVLKVLGTGTIEANVVAKVLAGSFAFIAHRHVTFPVRHRENFLFQLGKYAATLLLNTLLGSILLVLLSVAVEHVVAKILADIILIVITYTVSKQLVFRSRGSVPRTRLDQ